MQLTFIIDEKYLAAHILRCHSFSSVNHKDDIVEFQNLAWEKSEELYQTVTEKIFSPSDLHDVAIGSAVTNYLESLIECELFKSLLHQTVEFKRDIKSEWENNFKKSRKIVSELTGLNEELNDEFKIYLTHPSLRNGRNIGGNIILWGTSGSWTNYSTIYLWHEILHSFLPKTDVGHAVIELIADEELRIRLNGGSYPPFVGHKILEGIKSKILPTWRNYMLGENLNIRNFLESLEA